MKKRLLSYLLIGVLLLSPAYATLLPNFSLVNSYTDGQFIDVPPSAWCAEGVSIAYRLGIMNGKSATRFDPKGNLTLAETIKLACVIHSIDTTGSAEFPTGDPWYQPYVDYALKNQLLTTEYENYDVPATRADFARLFAHALPATALVPINTVEDDAIPDVRASDKYADEIYTLYRAGVLTGSNKKGNFGPSILIGRSEAAVIITRMVDPEQRFTITLWTNGTLHTAEKMLANCAPAVFHLEAYDKSGGLLSWSTGFFLSSDGRAVTNYHAIANVVSAKVYLMDGKEYNVASIYSYDETLDLAVIQVEGTGFPTLTRGDAKHLTAGEYVFAIGNPWVNGAMSPGFVSDPNCTIEGNEYIQITTPLSSSSAGSALLDATGKVVGVTMDGAINGKRINLAVPIQAVDALKFADKPFALPRVAASLNVQPGTSSTQYYDAYYPVPDLGALCGAQAISDSSSGSIHGYIVYPVKDMKLESEDVISRYDDLLKEQGFVFDGIYSNLYEHSIYSCYYNDEYRYSVTFGTALFEGEECIFIEISSYNYYYY